ncbi:orotate phosphoribosyltransferase [Thermovibrio ammonificans]|jgi:orotate phosphoribosyltransferase|uniref:Orotate phosphoribosyltransferase n=1 Tax=Thermovibrio ammonificans (strain DSM 15698 / JCM 12110 / HB-1) TaxID=648996 RepID=E8T349_THEA1|nr:orotate phosphoribosyltransferase [Thermovibrio ammonificans]ADU96054.1 orotate phosphoribosyltransferase [Thermovibrio ammonificans HB-1]
MLSEEQIKEIFLKADAFLEGHFLLSSGLHSPYYLQCAKVLQYPDYAELLCRELARRIREFGVEFDLVIAPAIGGIIVSYETARHLKVRGIFAERVNGELTLRRGFEIKPGERAVVVEDVVTTGKSTKETIEVVKAHGGKVVAVGSLVDRSGGKVDFGVPFASLWRLEVPVYSPESCPICKEGKLPLVKPGSRNIPVR